VKIRTVAAELLHASGRTDGRTAGRPDRQTDRLAWRFSQHCERA